MKHYLIRRIVLSLVCLPSLFSSLAYADETTVRLLYGEAVSMADMMYDDVLDVKQTEETYFDEQIQSNFNKLTAARDRLKENQTKIRKISNWKNRLSKQLAEDVAEVGLRYSSINVDRVRSDAFVSRGKMKRECQRLRDEAAPVDASIREAMNVGRFQSESQRKAARPHVAALRKVVTAHEARLDILYAEYQQNAERYDEKRELAGKHLWRFAHAFEDINNEPERKVIANALRNAAGLKGQAYQPGHEWAMFDSHLNLSPCPTYVGPTGYAIRLKRPAAYVNDYTLRPFEAFDEQQNFLPRPKLTGNTQLERAAQLLSHRQMQKFWIQGKIEKITPELSQQTQKVSRLTTMQTDMEDLAGRVDLALKDLRPAAELQNEVGAATELLASKQANLDRANKALRDFEIEQKFSDAEDSSKRYVQIGPTKFRPAKTSREGKPYAEWTQRIERRRKLITDILDPLEAHQKDLDSFPGGNTGSEYANNAIQILNLRDAVRGYDAELAALNLAKRSTDGPVSDDTAAALKAAQDAVEMARTDVQTACAALKEAEKRLEGGQSPEGLSRRRDALRSEVNLNVRAWLVTAEGETKDNLLGITAADRSQAASDNEFEVLSAIGSDLNKALESTNASLNQETESLSLIVRRAKALDMKHRAVQDMLIFSKIAAVNLLRQKIPASGESEDSELMQFLNTYSEKLSGMQTYLKGASGYLAKPGELQARVEQFNSVFDTELTTELGKVTESIKAANVFTGHLIAATETLKKNSDHAIILAKALTPPSSGSASSSFGHIQNVLNAAKLGLGQVPVVGAISGPYVQYMSESVRVINDKAHKIANAQFNGMQKAGLFNTPEAHLYTTQEVNSMDTDNDMFTRYARTQGEDFLTKLQARRIIAVLGAHNVNEACNRPLRTDRAKHCLQQGAIQ